MLKEEIKTIIGSQSRSDLRKFGITIGIALGLLAALAYYKQNPILLPLAGVAAAFLLAGLLLPTILRPVHRYWMTFAVTMGYMMTRVLLTLFFLIAFVPSGIVLRLLRLDVLKQKYDPNATTYWVPKEKSHSGKYSVESQF
ncbi:MAG: SxtJ family membrane protein [candidate division KSB1 bacterium]|nr:SxtJ family membrane protein [candidate division KSB1 bacterium]